MTDWEQVEATHIARCREMIDAHAATDDPVDRLLISAAFTVEVEDHFDAIRTQFAPQERAVRPGPKPGVCTVEGCQRKHYGRGWCHLHYQRWRRHGDPLVGGRSASTYTGIHTRLSKDPASQYECLRCGKQAQEWALYHCSENERTDRVTGFPFSLDVRDYEPMCRSCHRAMDRASRAS